jgi:hypothetical protein
MARPSAINAMIKPQINPFIASSSNVSIVLQGGSTIVPAAPIPLKRRLAR